MSDIGERNLEDVNLLRRGANYGWPEREGTYAINVEVDPNEVLPLPDDDASLGFTYPVAQYDHEEGRAIAGGAVYRGSRRSVLSETFVFGDIVTGRLFYAQVREMLCARRLTPETTAPVYELHITRDGTETNVLDLVREALGSPGIRRADLRFGTDARGDVYITTKQDGWVRRLALEDVQGGTRQPRLSRRGPRHGLTRRGHAIGDGLCHRRAHRDRRGLWSRLRKALAAKSDAP